MKKTGIATLLAVCCVIVPFATGQENELSGLIGRTFIENQTILNSLSSDNGLRFGDGLSFEGNYARHFVSGELMSLSLEIPFVVDPDEDLNAAIENKIPKQYMSFAVTPSARLNLFPHVAVSPWVSLGGGFVHYSASSNLFDGGKNTGNTSTTTGALQAGAGLDVKLVGNFSLRGELRDLWSGVPPLIVNTGKNRQTNLFVGGGIVWHF